MHADCFTIALDEKFALFCNCCLICRNNLDHINFTLHTSIDCTCGLAVSFSLLVVGDLHM